MATISSRYVPRKELSYSKKIDWNISYNQMGIYLVYKDLEHQGYTMDVASYILDRCITVLYKEHRITIQTFATLKATSKYSKPYYLFNIKPTDANIHADIYAFVVIHDDVIGYLPVMGNMQRKYHFWVKGYESYSKLVSNQNKKRVRELSKLGLSATEISRQVGLTAEWVRDIREGRCGSSDTVDKYLYKMSFRKALYEVMIHKEEIMGITGGI